MPAAKKQSSEKGAPSKPEEVAEAASAAAGLYLREQRSAIEPAEAEVTPSTRRRSGGDPLVGELRHQLLPMLVLHFISLQPSYGNQLIDQLTDLTHGVLTVNPNTMYPLLRNFEARGLIEGQWEHPERRSRRFYSLTDVGAEELQQLRPSADRALDSIGQTIARIRDALAD